jgi:hypothetical protein
MPIRRETEEERRRRRDWNSRRGESLGPNRSGSGRGDDSYRPTTHTGRLNANTPGIRVVRGLGEQSGDDTSSTKWKLRNTMKKLKNRRGRVTESFKRVIRKANEVKAAEKNMAVMKPSINNSPRFKKKKRVRRRIERSDFRPGL